VLAAPAGAKMNITSFSTSSSDTQAGGHPDLTTEFTLGEPGVDESARNVIFNAPEGLFGNPGAILKCTSDDFALEECVPNSQAGVVTVYANYEGDQNLLLGTAPIFNIVPGPDQTALFAFIVPQLQIPIQIPVEVRTGSDYGLRFTVAELTQVAPLAGAKLTFWGFPLGEAHDSQRFAKGAPGEPSGCPGLADASCQSGVKASLTNKPLIDNPTLCTGKKLPTTLEVQSYQDPEHRSVEGGQYPATIGCQKEVFKPVLLADLTTKNPMFFGTTPAPSQLRTSVVTLPPGLTINPDAADGQTACSEADAHFGTEGPASCQNTSKIGTFQINTPALEGPLIGSLYIGEPKPDEQYRVFMVADGFGVHAKLAGVVRPDPTTGQVTIIFEDLPQVPFDDIQFHLFASDRGLLATPTSCTSYELASHFYPWNVTAPDVISTEFINLDSGPNGSLCPGETRPFHPRLQAGTSDSVAGNYSSFTLRLDRDDGDQFLGDLNFKMPPGFTGNLRGIAYCPEGAITAAEHNLGRNEQLNPSCPAASQVGTTNVAAGPGQHPFHAYGKMYLAGPLKGAPISLVAVTPALAGPYDYGVVVVRVALHVDPLTAQVTAESDRVPSIIGGIPIRLRSIQVNIDKPDFTINPTNCSPFTVDSQGIGDQGTVTDFSSPFTVVNCSTMNFKPKMTVKLMGGRKATHRTVNPALRFDLKTRPGDTNIKAISVTLPSAFEIDQRHLGNICSEKQLAQTECAGRTPIGEASTTTPLLDAPLSGPVYAVSGSGGLPRLAFILDGQVKLIPRAEEKTVGIGKLQTTVPVVPDAPIGHFRLDVFGGKRGYLINTRDICKRTPVVGIDYTAQSGRTRSERVAVKATCGKHQPKSSPRSSGAH
jgi:hypothetical protein